MQRNPSQSRSRSTNRPPFVREETDGGTEKALVPSPKFSTGREPFPDDVSDITERERIVEAETRHVSFREPGSEKDAHEGWTESVRPESSVGERGE